MKAPAQTVTCHKAIVIGGSAGSIPVIIKLLNALPANFQTPLIVCLHRTKNESAGMLHVFSQNCKLKIIEPDDKEELRNGGIYLAPSNYHLLIEKDRTINLSTDIPVNYSRPCIDLTFETASVAFKKNLTGILLTGANSDGALGMQAIYKNGGMTIVQDPAQCAAAAMPLAALKLNCVNYIMTIEQIILYLGDHL